MTTGGAMLLVEVRCSGCGTQLLGESYQGEPRKMFAPPTAEMLAWRYGWRDGLCPGCKPATEPAA